MLRCCGACALDHWDQSFGDVGIGDVSGMKTPSILQVTPAGRREQQAEERLYRWTEVRLPTNQFVLIRFEILRWVLLALLTQLYVLKQDDLLREEEEYREHRRFEHEAKIAVWFNSARCWWFCCESAPIAIPLASLKDYRTATWPV